MERLKKIVHQICLTYGCFAPKSVEFYELLLQEIRKKQTTPQELLDSFSYYSKKEKLEGSLLSIIIFSNALLMKRNRDREILAEKNKYKEWENDKKNALSYEKVIEKFGKGKTVSEIIAETTNKRLANASNAEKDIQNCTTIEQLQQFKSMFAGSPLWDKYNKLISKREYEIYSNLSKNNNYEDN